jgi:hypothetical protein
VPGFGCIPARGNWEHRLSAISSGATFAKGSLVALDSGYLVREYLSTDSQVFGIAMSHSTASLPGPGLAGGVGNIPLAYASFNSGAVVVAIPAPGCTFYSDLTTGITQSSLSIGKSVLMYKQGNMMSYASTLFGQSSGFSQTVTIVGPIDSANSRVECAFNVLATVFYSASTHTFAS